LLLVMMGSMHSVLTLRALTPKDLMQLALTPKDLMQLALTLRALTR